MSLEGLHAILDKDEVVATQRAEDLIAHPAMVDETYRRHVRTYVPFGRQSSGGDGKSVIDFEKEVIREVKGNGAVRGYITAEYGYGKTSTALYLWDRARDANLLAVPPFQLNKLTDFIQATFGWVRYEIGRTRPGSPLPARAEELYQSLIERDAAAYARRYNIAESAARQMIRDKPDILELTPADYIRYFEQMTGLARDAGYDGLLLLADELQQYIDPQVKAGIKDPVAPFFDVVANILTRRGHLPFGLIVVIPPRELDVLRDQRGDFIHRLLQASLDLRTVYDQEFPARLWRSLAREHDFEDHRDRIITADSLAALGQIGARTDLADGPRTVVNTFRRAVRLYGERGHPHDRPYTPEGLLNDLLNGAIQYDSSKRIPQAAARALDHSLVRGRPAHERAVKWAAAFPNEGVTREMQERHGLAEAFDDLARSALGDLLISIGDVRHRGFTLAGLERSQVQSDWLSSTVREFWRNYVETADITRQRAMDGMTSLLRSRVFPDNQWKVLRQLEERFTQNAGLVVRGAFTTGRQSYPDRTVHVRLLWEDEAAKDANIQGEVLLEIRLRRYLEQTEGERRVHEEPLRIDNDGRAIHMTLNLMGRSLDLSPTLDQRIGPVVSPFKLTPLLLLNLHEVIEGFRARSAIPKEVEQEIGYYFQPELLGNAFRQMFNETVGRPVGAAEERIVELALMQLLKSIYPDYRPLSVVQNWQSSLQKYENALSRLDSNYERQGQADVEGTKETIAKLFTLSSTGLDSLARNFPTLIDGVSKLPGTGQGVVRFTLHPLEKEVLIWLRDGQSQTVRAGGQSQTVKAQPKNIIYDLAQQLGYLEDEINTLLGLMQARGLVDEDAAKGLWREAVTLAPSVDELIAAIDECLGDIAALRRVFSNDPQLADWEGAAGRTRQHADEQLRKKPDDTQLYQRKKGVSKLREQIDNYATAKRADLRQDVERVGRQLTPPDPRQRSQLSTPIQGSVEYVSQVNDQLRVGLLKQHMKLESTLNEVHAQISAVQSGLARDDLSVIALAELAEEARRLHTTVTQARKQQDNFAKQYGDYADWISLIDGGNRLSEELNQMGELVNEQRAAFEQLTRDIRGHLSAHKMEGLPDAPGFSIRLNEISQAVRDVRATTTNEFAQLQDRYRQTIADMVGFPADRLWAPHHFNPLAPHDSYVRLREDVGKTVRGAIISQFRKLIADQRSAIRDTRQSPLLPTLPNEEQRRIRSQADSLDSELGQLDEKLLTAHQIAADASIFADFPAEGGRFRQLLVQLGDSARHILKLRPDVENLSRELQKLELTPQENVLLAAVSSGNSAVDFGAIRQSAGLPNDEFWQALGGLQAKRRVRIQIERVAYD